MPMNRIFFRLAAAATAVLLFAACGQPHRKAGAEVLLHTTMGDIRVALDDRTPLHRDNFLKLTREGFFDSLLFHRVIADFMIQAGDPASRRTPADWMPGSSDAGYEIPAEIVYPALAHTRGALSGARMPDSVNPERKSSGSQFFIVWGKTFDDEGLDKIQARIDAATGGKVVIPDSLRTLYKTVGGTPFLDGQYTVFGHVTAGLDVVDAIQRVATDSLDRPLADVRILSAEDHHPGREFRALPRRRRGPFDGARHGAHRGPCGGFRRTADDCRGADCPAAEKEEIKGICVLRTS